MRNRMQLARLRRGDKVHVKVGDHTPYVVVDAVTQSRLGTTLSNNEGIYMHNVNFKVINGQAVVEGRYKGKLEKDRLNISRGVGVSFNKDDNEFKMGDNMLPVRTARMVQLFNGIIKIVIK